MDENIFTWMNLTSSKIMDEFFFKKKMLVALDWC